MGQITESTVNFFKGDGWNFRQIEGEPVFITDFVGDNGEWRCYAFADEESEQFIFYSICPIKPPKNKRQAVADLLTRINYGMPIGNFELNFVDGDIRYKTSIHVQNDRLSSALIKHVVYNNLVMMDEYLPSIMKVIYSNVPPELAVTEIELTKTSST